MVAPKVSLVQRFHCTYLTGNFSILRGLDIPVSMTTVILLGSIRLERGADFMTVP